MSFAENLKTKRKELGLSQPQAAKIVGCSLTYFNRYENGKQEPAEDKKRIIMERLNDYSVGEENNYTIDTMLSMEFELAKKRREENRMLLFLLKTMGFEVVSNEDTEFRIVANDNPVTDWMSLDEMFALLERCKQAMCNHVNEIIRGAKQ